MKREVSGRIGKNLERCLAIPWIAFYGEKRFKTIALCGGSAETCGLMLQTLTSIYI